MGEFVRLEVSDGVGTIRLDRPKMNALDAQMQHEIAEASVEADSRDDVAAVVVFGGERVFAAGADILEMGTMSYQQMSRHAATLQAFTRALAGNRQAHRLGHHGLRARWRLRGRAVHRRAVRR